MCRRIGQVQLSETKPAEPAEFTNKNAQNQKKVNLNRLILHKIENFINKMKEFVIKSRILVWIRKKMALICDVLATIKEVFYKGNHVRLLALTVFMLLIFSPELVPIVYMKFVCFFSGGIIIIAGVFLLIIHLVKLNKTSYVPEISQMLSFLIVIGLSASILLIYIGVEDLIVKKHITLSLLFPEEWFPLK